MPNDRRTEPPGRCRAPRRLACALAALAPALGAAAAEPPSSAYAGAEAPAARAKRLYWGDLHQHSYYSADAALFGNHLVGPDEAYRFAKGETVRSSIGKPARLRTALDFMAVTDHAETMALIWRWRHPDDAMRRSAPLRQTLGIVRDGLAAIPEGADALSSLLSAFAHPDALGQIDDADAARSTWREILAAAERHNAPHRFTALIGYEWSATPGGDNLHRIVLYRDGAERAAASLPIDTAAADTDPSAAHPETLWAGLEAWERRTGGQAIAIPHNSNLSGGRMFRPQPSVGRMSVEYARRRARWEPIVEVTQIKGDSESHPLLSPTDAFAGYETWDTNVMNTRRHTPDDVIGDYAREALKIGLALRRRHGANPFRFGMIGSADSHTGLAAVDEDNFWGKAPMSAPRPGRMAGFWSKEGQGPSVLSIANSALAASGVAAVWADENTREGIFDALRRREVYATTGPRISVRFFGGWNFSVDDLRRADFARIGYRRGVPMGGALAPAPGPGAPTFMVSALKDPAGANLDRVQIVKGWVTAAGDRRERVYDVAVSDGRRIGRNGRAAKPVGNTVDVDDASYRNTIGAAALSAHWRDPRFRPGQDAFYYVRALEIPTPRWTAYDAAHFGEPLPDGVPATTQERAYTSPIWYEP